MHYTGTIWRPPYEADSLLLEVTAGCTHHKCKFCTLYSDLPFKFRMSPMKDIENDLLEVQTLRTNPYSKMLTRLQGKDAPEPIRRVFLTGANPFILKTEKLLEISTLIKKYLPSVTSIGCFARITDSVNKTDDDLMLLRNAGYNGLTIGVETGDDNALAFMRKGYTSQDIQNENWEEEGELEKYRELRALVENLNISTYFAAMGASNAFQLRGRLPDDKKHLLNTLDKIISEVSEEDLRHYRKNLRHL